MQIEEKVVYPKLSFKIVGILFEVQNELGRYCNEKQYSDLIEEKFKKINIRYEREKTLDKYFPAEKPGRHRIDFLVDDKIILEIKAKSVIARDDYYQTRRYLEVSNKKLGLIVNFHSPYLRPKRVLNPKCTLL